MLEALLPHGTELDLWRGKTFVSMVGFRFLKTRVPAVLRMTRRIARSDTPHCRQS